jgi:hypothetical protein
MSPFLFLLKREAKRHVVPLAPRSAALLPELVDKIKLDVWRTPLMKHRWGKGGFYGGYIPLYRKRIIVFTCCLQQLGLQDLRNVYETMIQGLSHELTHASQNLRGTLTPFTSLPEWWKYKRTYWLHPTEIEAYVRQIKESCRIAKIPFQFGLENFLANFKGKANLPEVYEAWFRFYAAHYGEPYLPSIRYIPADIMVWAELEAIKMEKEAEEGTLPPFVLPLPDHEDLVLGLARSENSLRNRPDFPPPPMISQEPASMPPELEELLRKYEATPMPEFKAPEPHPMPSREKMIRQYEERFGPRSHRGEDND